MLRVLQALGRPLRALLDSPATALALLVGAYAAIALTGVVGLLAPHTLSADQWFYYPSAAGALLALLGGALGGLSIPLGIWWLERGAIAFMLGAIGCRIYSLAFQLTHDASPLGEVLISIAFLASIALGMLVRLLYIRGLALDPRM